MLFIFRHKDAKIGSNINYDHNGRIVKVEKSARSVGTTVTLSDIFSTMPVRFKEFQRNIKKEFSKLCQVSIKKVLHKDLLPNVL